MSLLEKFQELLSAVVQGFTALSDLILGNEPD